MLPARKSAWRDRLMYVYLRRMLGGAFRDVRLRGREHLAALDPSRPVLAVSNHAGWWDGLMIFRLTRVLAERDFYCMMEEKQLRPNRFFTWIGAFGVNLDDRRESARSLRYALDLLARPGALVWVFPQGELASPHQPIVVKPGAAFLARKAEGVQVLPLALRYEFLRDEKPHALIEAGAPLAPAAGAFSDEQIRIGLEAVGARLDAAVRTMDVGEGAGFELLERPRWSVNKRWEWCQLALTGRLAQFDPEN
ncbi:MAG: lysophospholipid acyltransferase family protein [Verrucomicrobiota bacterium]